MPARVSLAFVLLATLAASPACRCSSPDEDESLLAPKHPIVVPPDLRIALEIDGQSAPPIDAAKLNSATPDFQSASARAWRLSTLVGAAVYARPGNILAIEQNDGARAIFALASDKVDGRVPSLVIDRRSEIVFARLQPGDPFALMRPAAAGRARSVDLASRIHNVRRIRLYLQSKRSTSEPISAVRVVLVGDHGAGDHDHGAGAPQSWGRADLDAVKPLGSGRGDGERWSLRDVIAQRIGAHARVTSIQGEGERSIEIDPAAWKNKRRVPTLRWSRHGAPSFQWTTSALQPVDPELAGVTEIRVRP